MLVRTSSFRTLDPSQLWNGSLRDVTRLFDAAFTGGEVANGQERPGWQWTPAADAAEDDKGITLTLELPGVKPDQIKIEVENNRLTIKGHKELQTTDETGRVHRFVRKHPELLDRIPKKELASYLNLSAETLSRLKHQGKI